VERTDGEGGGGIAEMGEDGYPEAKHACATARGGGGSNGGISGCLLVRWSQVRCSLIASDSTCVFINSGSDRH
jgi:hypothetical protein